MRVSGDDTVHGQLVRTKLGRLVTELPEGILLVANSYIYTDWNSMHSHVYINQKEWLTYIALIGPGMMFYNFIFLGA